MKRHLASFLAIGMLLFTPHLLASSKDKVSGEVYTLYRTFDGKATGRVHIATFDNASEPVVNQMNCQSIAESLAKKSTVTKFWCEKGRFKE